MTGDPEISFVHRDIPIRIRGFAADDHIFASIVETGSFYEMDLLEYMRAVLGSSNPCVIDVGGNIGNHSVYFGKYIAGFVVAIEANPAVADILELNLRSNHVPHAVYRLGLGAAPGFASIELAQEHSRNIGAARLKLAGTGTPAGTATIPVTTLDALSTELEERLGGRPVTAIKIDIEGMEPEALTGAMGFLKRQHPELFVETIDAGKLLEVEELLKPLGYFRVLARASTPVWHFSHWRNLSFSRLVRFAIYLVRHRASIFPARISGLLGRFLKANGTSR